jgi:hypothetical protein
VTIYKVYTWRTMTAYKIGFDTSQEKRRVSGCSACVRMCVRVRACVWREREPVSECPLQSPPGDGQWPAAVRPLLLLKTRPHFKTCKSLGKNKNMVRMPTAPETKIYCDGEGQQQFYQPTDQEKNDHSRKWYDLWTEGQWFIVDYWVSYDYFSDSTGKTSGHAAA